MVANIPDDGLLGCAQIEVDDAPVVGAFGMLVRNDDRTLPDEFRDPAGREMDEAALLAVLLEHDGVESATSGKDIAHSDG